MIPYDHNLTSKIPKALDREQNEQLYTRVMADDDTAREEMIEGNMPLVITKVESFIRINPQLAYLRDDLHSAGFVGLVKAVNKMAEHEEPSKVNPTGYISVAITHEIVKLARKEAVDSGIELANSPEIDVNPADHIPVVSHGVPESVVDPNQSVATELFELRDLLESCCESDEERTLIRMREEGYSDCDIAKAINIPRPSLQRLRKELEERFNRKCRELEE